MSITVKLLAMANIRKMFDLSNFPSERFETLMLIHYPNTGQMAIASKSSACIIFKIKVKTINTASLRDKKIHL